jgi:hypothetical protein
VEAARTGAAVRLEAVVADDGRGAMEVVEIISSKGDQVEPLETVTIRMMGQITKLMCSVMVSSERVRDDPTSMATAIGMLMAILVVMVAGSLAAEETSTIGGMVGMEIIIGTLVMAGIMLLKTLPTP